MKIIYLIAGTYRPAGMERVLSMKAGWLSKDNEVVIVTTDQMGREPVFGLGNCRQIDLGIDYEETNGANFIVKAVKYVFKHLKHRRLLNQTLMHEKADIVVSMFNNDVDILPGIKDGSRKVLEVHFSRFKRIQYGRKGLWKLADEFRSRNEVKDAARFDRFVVLTEEDKSYWEADYKKAGLESNIVCIPNARTFTFDAPAPLTGRQVLAAGRFSHQKGFDMLLEAWKLVLIPGWTLRIAGDGEIPTELPDNVIAGPSSDIKKEYQESSLFVLSSRYEGFGMVLVEAQAAGVPMVSFNCKCGPSEIITDGEDGFLVPAEDIAALADRMKQLMEDEALRKRMGLAAFRNSARFDEAVIFGKWKELFESLE